MANLVGEVEGGFLNRSSKNLGRHVSEAQQQIRAGGKKCKCRKRAKAERTFRLELGSVPWGSRGLQSRGGRKNRPLSSRGKGMP